MSDASGRDYYADLYRRETDREAEWLRRTSGGKVDAVERLLAARGIAPSTVLEVGAGTGAVIGGLRQRGVGDRHYAVDFSPDAVGVLQASEPGVTAAVADVLEAPDPFGAGPYDVVLASHVVEHLEEPTAFLRGLHRVPSEWLIVEVPLEDLWFGRVKARGGSRVDHPAGHVQFFDRERFLSLVADAGWDAVEETTYAPVMSDDAFSFAYGDASPVRRAHKTLTERVLPRVLGGAWTRLYHAHCAVLCRRTA